MRKFAFGAGISVILLYFALRNIDWAALGKALLEVRLVFAAACALMIGMGVLLRALRWWLLADHEPRLLGHFVHATNLGVLANMLLPVRLAEVVRGLAIIRRTPIGLARALSAAIIERAIDALILLLSAAILSYFLAAGILSQLWIAGLGLVLLVIVLSLALVRRPFIRAGLMTLAERWLQRWALRAENLLNALDAAVHRNAQLRRSALLIGAMVMVWLADYLAVSAALMSAGLDLPLLAPLLAWVMLAAVWALAVYQVPAHSAVVFSWCCSWRPSGFHCHSPAVRPSSYSEGNERDAKIVGTDPDVRMGLSSQPAEAKQIAGGRYPF